MHTKNCSTSHRSRTSKFQHAARVLGRAKCLRRNDAATRATPEQHDKKTRMGHVFVPHFGEPCRSFILGNVSWYVDASGAALHVTWRVLEKRASEQNTVLIRQKKRIAVISTCMRSPPYIIIITIVITH